MYDPEIALKLNSDLNLLKEFGKNAKLKFEDNHPIIKLYETLYVGFENAISLKNDYDNCFNELEKETILKELNIFLKELNKTRLILSKIITE